MIMVPVKKAEVSFTYLQEIGQDGQNSKVHKSYDNNLRATLAIKEIVKAPGIQLCQYFSEAQILYKSNHPNVSQVMYACEDTDKVYIASPFYQNGSLKKVLSQGFLTSKEIIRYSTHILNGLQNIHSKGLVHFDLKPDNILISDRNEALIADFGQSMHLKGGLAYQPRLYPRTLAPEACVNVLNQEQNPYDSRFDIFGIGMTMYRMCVGPDCFESQFSQYNDWTPFYTAIVRGRFPNKKIFPLHIPKKLQTIIRKCLQPDPVKRYQSPIAIVNALADIDGPILDWKYSITGNDKVWEKFEGGALKKSITVNSNNKSLAYTHSSCTKRKINAYCINGITKDKIIEFLENN